jgi:hypothetical protein
MTANKEIVKVQYGLLAGKYGGQLIYPSDWVRASLASQMLEMPSEADLSSVSTIQKYPVGTQLRKNGKLYRYSKAGSTKGHGAIGLLMYSQIQCPGKKGNSLHSGYEEAIAASVVAGATSFTITDSAAYKNEYEGALIVVYNGTDDCWEQHTIIANDVSNGTTTTLYIAPPGFKYAVTGVAGTGYGTSIYLNPYSVVTLYSGGATGYESYKSVVGYTGVELAINDYFWLQTAGPCTGIQQEGGYTCGVVAYARDVFAYTDGCCYGQASTARYYQRIGYLLSATSSDYSDNFIMLQLDQ